MVIDTDPQQTLATWWELREADTPQLAPATPGRQRDGLETLAHMGIAYCFVDTPPALTEQNGRLMTLADLVLIPARPSPTDLWALGATLDLVRQAATPFAFVMTQAKWNARITVQAMAALSEHGQIFPTVVHDRVDYAVAMTDGRTALEIRPGGAAAEAADLWRNTRERLGA